MWSGTNLHETRAGGCPHDFGMTRAVHDLQGIYTANNGTEALSGDQRLSRIYRKKGKKKDNADEDRRNDLIRSYGIDSRVGAEKVNPCEHVPSILMRSALDLGWPPLRFFFVADLP